MPQPDLTLLHGRDACPMCSGRGGELIAHGGVDRWVDCGWCDGTGQTPGLLEWMGWDEDDADTPDAS